MIPYLLIAVGGVMILAGVNDQSPLAILKAVLTNSSLPDKGPNALGNKDAPSATPPNTNPGTSGGSGLPTGSHEPG